MTVSPISNGEGRDGQKMRENGKKQKSTIACKISEKQRAKKPVSTGGLTRKAKVEKQTELDYKVIATGSKGNAVRIGDIMIDCGIPYKDMKEELYKVNTLLITHRHSDHIKEGTFRKIRQDFPDIKIYANADVAYLYDVDVVVGTAKVQLGKNRWVLPFEGVHDVPTTGYVIHMDRQDILYMTDSNCVPAPEGMTYDWIFLESNYDEIKIRELSKQYKTRGYDPYESSFRHLSTQKCKEFYYLNRKSPESKLIELHMSSRFY